MKCDFCQKKCDDKIVLRDLCLKKTDGSDIHLCSECLNYYANGEYDKIKIPKVGGKRRK